MAVLVHIKWKSQDGKHVHVCVCAHFQDPLWQPPAMLSCWPQLARLSPHGPVIWSVIWSWRCVGFQWLVPNLICSKILVVSMPTFVQQTFLGMPIYPMSRCACGQWGKGASKIMPFPQSRTELSSHSPPKGDHTYWPGLYPGKWNAVKLFGLFLRHQQNS